MNNSLPVVLVLDISALLVSRTLEWQEFARIGTCGIPEEVLAEIQFLCDRAPEPAQEQTAREFTRFWTQSGWQVWSVSASHPSLTSGTAATLSKTARLSLAVAQTAYGTAQQHPDQLVVLVANQQPLLSRLSALNAQNLCGITLTALVQWVRTQQKPPAVTQQLRSLVATGPQSTPERLPAAPTMPGPASGILPVRIRSQRPGCLTQMASAALAIVALATAGLLAWRLLQPASFQQFWRQSGLPALPGDPPLQPARPAKSR